MISNMYSQDDLTEDLFELQNGDGLAFTNAPDAFCFAEWLIFNHTLTEYKQDYLRRNSVLSFYRTVVEKNTQS